jgi:hypothetical protein
MHPTRTSTSRKRITKKSQVFLIVLWPLYVLCESKTMVVGAPTSITVCANCVVVEEGPNHERNKVPLTGNWTT